MSGSKPTVRRLVIACFAMLVLLAGFLAPCEAACSMQPTAVAVAHISGCCPETCNHGNDTAVLKASSCHRDAADSVIAEVISSYPGDRAALALVHAWPVSDATLSVEPTRGIAHFAANGVAVSPPRVSAFIPLRV